MKNNYFLIFLLFITSLLHSQTVQVEDHWWVTDGNVNSVAKEGNTIYLGGTFTRVMPNIPFGASVSPATGEPDLNSLRLNASVYSIVPDGAGGWYIAGQFTTVGGQPRNRLARINSDGTLHPWNPDANASVQAIAISGNTIYAGGTFTTIGGQSRSRIAAIDATTGLVTSWDPNSNNVVYTLAIDGNTVYAGGGFTTIGGQSRNRIAALDATTGLATAWDPNTNNIVYAVATNGNTVYVGGDFTAIGGQSRNRIAAIDVTTGLANTWNPNANSYLLTIAISGNTIYAGGLFSNIGGQSRNRIAALDATTGLATSWNPNVSSGGSVYTIALNGNDVYAGGGFSVIGGQSRNNVAAIDATTGLVTSWNPNAGYNVANAVRAIAINGSDMYIGGQFNGIGGITRNNIVALDATTGQPTSWNANANNVVKSVVVNSNTVYAGGNFTTIGGQSRNRIAALDATTGSATSWDPNANNSVSTIAINGTTVYAGGDFTTIGGQSRNYIAALDATSGLAASWNPNANNTVNTIDASGSTIYTGGYFATIGGQSRNYIAALDATSGSATSWNPSANNIVNKIVVNGSTIYVGGTSFTTIGGQTRNNIAAIDASTGLATSWDPNANGAVRAIAINGNTVFAGGDFTNIAGQSRNRIAAIDATTGLTTSWNPSIDPSVVDMLFDNGKIYSAGSFYTASGFQKKGFAVFNVCTLTATAGAQTNILCHGNATGEATITATGGTGAYTYSWDTTPAQTTATATGLAAGTYTATVTDANNCTATQSFTITEPAAALTASAGTQVDVLCQGAATGEATVNVTGGTGAYTYSWNTTPAQTTATATGLTIGMYTVTVTDANLCTTTQNFTIRDPYSTGTIYTQDFEGTFPWGMTVSAINGTSNVWFKRGIASGANQAGGTGYFASADSDYTCSTGWDTVLVTPALDFTGHTGVSLTFNSYFQDFAGADDAWVDVSTNGGTTWATAFHETNDMPVGPVTVDLGAYDTMANVLVRWRYSDNNDGCAWYWNIDNIVIQTSGVAPLAVTAGPQTNVLCHGNATGQATVNVAGGIGTHTYSWDTTPAQTTATATGLAAGTYTVTVTDGNGCSKTQAFTITEPSASLVATAGTQIDVLCFGTTTGEATVNATGGTGAYTYSWDTTPAQTTATATGLAAGTYTATVTDANLCTTTQAFTITQPAASLTATAGPQTNVLCYGNTTGTATVNATGGTGAYTYSWDTTPAQTTATATGLAAGTYTATVTDANLCTTTQAFTITEPAAALVATAGTQVDVLCFGNATGQATVNVTGGTGAYSYSWDTTPVQTTATAAGLAAGTYTATVTDANLCTTTQTFIITQPSALVATAGLQTNVLCFGNATGAATVNVTGGTGAYTYSWNTTPIQTTATASGLATGTYTVTVTDANGCIATQSFTITQPAASLTATAGPQANVLCYGNTTGTATVNATGGTGSYTYSWDTTPAQTTATATGLAAGTYTATVTDANLCTTTQTFTITQPAALLTATAGPQSNVSCFGDTNGSATVNATGGTGTYTYSWNTIPVQTTAMAIGLAAGTYTVTVTDANGCTTTQSFTITGPQQLTAAINSSTNVLCFGAATGSATVSATGGTSPYSYLWSDGQTTAIANGLTAGSYTVVVTDANGCHINAGISITQPATPLVVTAGSQINLLCNGNNNGSATVNVTGGVGTYTYSWNTTPVQTTATAIGLAAGNYTATVTDSNGCTDSVVVTITSPNALTASFTVTNANCSTTGSAIVNPAGGVAPYTYLWSNNSATNSIQNVLPGAYTVTVTDSNGCSAIFNTTISGSAPIVIISAPQSVVIDGGETVVFTVEAQNVTTYQWQVSKNGGQSFTNLNLGGSLPTYYGVSTATLTVANAYQSIDGYLYRVILMQQNGCYILSDAAELTVNAPVAGIDDVKHLEMTIYPNPASTDVFVKIPDFGLYGDIKVAMYDLNGRIVRKEELITSENYRIDVTGLESAIYILSITSDAGRTDKKITVKK